MSRYIDADAFKTWIDEYVSVFKKSNKAEIKGYISHQPSIDIVRCGECENFIPMTHGCKRSPSVEPWWEDDFCSYGERLE